MLHLLIELVATLLKEPTLRDLRSFPLQKILEGPSSADAPHQAEAIVALTLINFIAATLLRTPDMLGWIHTVDPPKGLRVP